MTSAEPADDRWPAEDVAAALPTCWTAEHAGLRLVEAMTTLDRLPRVKGPRQAGNHWMPHALEWADRVAQAELPRDERIEREKRRNDLAMRPSGRDIDRMDLALDWLRDLRSRDSGLALVLTLWAWRTARRRSIRALCRERGWAPTTLYTLRGRALDQIAAALNDRGAPVF